MRLRTYYEFPILGELCLEIEYDYEEGQPLIMWPVEDSQPEEPAGVIIDLIYHVCGTNRIALQIDDDDEGVKVLNEFEELCMADFQDVAQSAMEEAADQQYQEMRDEK